MAASVIIDYVNMDCNKLAIDYYMAVSYSEYRFDHKVSQLRVPLEQEGVITYLSQILHLIS